MSERLVTNLQELLAVSTKPLPDIPSLAENLRSSETEMVEKRKDILDSLLGVIGNDRVWNLLFYASAIHSGDETLEEALLRYSRIEFPESAILVSRLEERWLTLIKSDKGTEWGEESDTGFGGRQLATMALNFPRATERTLRVLYNKVEFFEEILASLAERFGNAAYIPAEMKSVAENKGIRISENQEEIDMLTKLAHSLEATITP